MRETKSLEERQSEMKSRLTAKPVEEKRPRQVCCPECGELVRVYAGGLELHFLPSGMTCRWSGRKW